MISPHSRVVILVASLYYPELSLVEILDKVTKRDFVERLAERIAKDIETNEVLESSGIKISFDEDKKEIKR